jgi:hypothetical protein
MRRYEDPREDLRLILIVGICLSILIITLALVMFALREEWRARSGFTLGANVLFVPSVKAGAVPALKGAVSLRGVSPLRIKPLPALGVCARWHLPKYTRNYFQF